MQLHFFQSPFGFKGRKSYLQLPSIQHTHVQWPATLNIIMVLIPNNRREWDSTTLSPVLSLLYCIARNDCWLLNLDVLAPNDVLNGIGGFKFGISIHTWGRNCDRFLIFRLKSIPLKCGSKSFPPPTPTPTLRVLQSKYCMLLLYLLSIMKLCDFYTLDGDFPLCWGQGCVPKILLQNAGKAISASQFCLRWCRGTQ